MSFSSDVKRELEQHIGASRHCRLAELGAIVAMSGRVVKGRYEPDAENAFVKEKQEKLLKLLLLDINSEEACKALKLIPTGEGFITDRMLVERSCCKQAYIRGAFLANGSVTNPEKGYHFEIVCNSSGQAELILEIMRDLGLDAKMILRKKYHVVYLKDGSMIVDILNIMGAHISLMNMENVRIIKDVRNTLNRQVNCEAANLNKTVNASVKQTEDILYIERTRGLGFLPDNLRSVATLRLEQSDLSLKELGEMLNPPLGKSGVNHRLRKISEIASELRRNNYDK